MLVDPPMILVPPTDPALWTPALPVTDFAAPTLGQLIYEMVRLKIVHNGAGLAAPQVGVSLRVFIMHDGQHVRVCINPVILNHGRDEDEELEGCLSFPGQHVLVKRWRVITMAYHDLNKVVTRTFKGRAARVAQHELDHLDGVCIFAREIA